MSSERSVSRNFLALVSGEAISRVIAFVAVVYIARVLGADGYGVIAFAVGINLYLSKIADFAIEWVGSREIARNPASGTGKSERLKHFDREVWSRRSSREHRLVYVVYPEDELVEIVSCKSHYEGLL